MNAPFVKPVLDRPHGLWSLWEIMKPFYADLFMRMMENLGGARVQDVWSKGFPPSRDVDVINDSDKALHNAAYVAFELSCTELGLIASRASVQKMQAVLAQSDSKRSDILSLELELCGRLVDEMEGRLFLP